MSDLGSRLARLGLSQYLEVFTAEGFDTWDTVLDITESDLSHLNVRLGHRRKLQRAIAESRGQSFDRPLPATPGRTTSVDELYRSGDESALESKGKETVTSSSGATVTKRKYRRHPKPDEHAPERPPSAYVIFSSHVRELLKGQDLSFTEIAKIVGERWQVLPSTEREAFERQANSAKEKYYSGLVEYKRTPQYEAYQKYLEDFKAKQAAPTKGKRSKLETETSMSTRSSSHEQHEQTANRSLSTAQLEPSNTGQQRAGSTPPIGPARLPAGPSYPSKPTSPVSHPFSGISSPRVDVTHSSLSASPRSATMHKDMMFDLSSSASVRDSRSLLDPNLPYPSMKYTHPSQQPASTTPPSYPFMPLPSVPIELPSRRTLRDNSTRLPPLTHEDTTWSSESGHSGYNIPLAGFSGSLLPLDPTKTLRTLPQPVPNIGPLQSPLDRQPSLLGAHSQLPPQTLDLRTQGPLAALLRAGKLASREADADAMDEDISP